MFSLSLSFSLDCSLSLSCVRTLSLSPLARFLSQTRINTHTHTHSLCPSFFLSFSLSLSFFLSLFLPLSLSFSLSHTPSLVLTHTYHPPINPPAHLQKILKARLGYPQDMPKAARRCIREFLQPDRSKRLGNINGGVRLVKVQMLCVAVCFSVLQ